eukprot:gene8795-33665_t
MQDKRQVLADILVWAEMTAPGYDQRAAAFITAPHAGDDSFQRIGKFLASAKQAAGLAHASPHSDDSLRRIRQLLVSVKQAAGLAHGTDMGGSLPRQLHHHAADPGIHSQPATASHEPSHHCWYQRSKQRAWLVSNVLPYSLSCSRSRLVFPLGGEWKGDKV